MYSPDQHPSHPVHEFVARMYPSEAMSAHLSEMRRRIRAEATERLDAAVAFVTVADRARRGVQPFAR